MIAQYALVAEASPTTRGVGAGLLESSVGTGGSVGPIIAGVVSCQSLTIPFLVPIFGFLLGTLVANLGRFFSDNCKENDSPPSTVPK